MAKVQRGDPLSRGTAEDHNAAVDVAEWFKHRAHSIEVGPEGQADNDVILVRNDEAELVIPRFGLIELTGVVLDGLALGQRPSTALPLLEYVAIAVGPIRAQALGPAWISGYHPLLTDGAGGLSYPCRGASQENLFSVEDVANGNIRLLGQVPHDTLLLALAELPLAALPPAPEVSSVPYFNVTTGLVEWIETTTECPGT